MNTIDLSPRNHKNKVVIMDNYKIQWRARLTHYRDNYDDASVYLYQDSDNDFCFDAKFINEVQSLDGRSEYDVLVSKIGKTDWRRPECGSVSNLSLVKQNIEEFFSANGLAPAKAPPHRVVFE